MILEQFSHAGKSVLVTGSSRGLGAGIATALAEAGARVALHGSSRVPETATRSFAEKAYEYIAVTRNVSDPEACNEIVKQVVAQFGTIDILVNNAATIGRAAAIDHPWEDWQDVL